MKIISNPLVELFLVFTMVLMYLLFSSLFIREDINGDSIIKSSEIIKILTTPVISHSNKIKPLNQSKIISRPIKIDSVHQRILLTGDSMTEGLIYPFIELSKQNDHYFTAFPVYNSTTKSFAESDTLAKLIKRFKPTYVLLALGSNELFIKKVESRAKYIDNILRQAKDVNLIWIGPPNWKEGTGINDLILSKIGKGNFFESRYLKFERERDGAHPTRKSGRYWADTISKWISNPLECSKPITLKARVEVNTSNQGDKNIRP